MAKPPKPLIAPANEPAPVSLFLAMAARALVQGEATEHQQKLLVQWLIFKACGKSYPPFHATDRDTAFALGRHFVADQFNGLLTVDLDVLRRT